MPLAIRGAPALGMYAGGPGDIREQCAIFGLIKGPRDSSLARMHSPNPDRLNQPSPATGKPSPLQADQSVGEHAPRDPEADTVEPTVREIGGRKGPEPTRYGDWEKNGRCIDF